MPRPDWTFAGLVPFSGLLSWNQYDPDDAADGAMNDYSGNGKHLVQASTPPSLVPGVMNNQPGWFFDGTSNPLKSASSASITVKHAFVLASATGAAFDAYRGLLTGKTAGPILISENTGTKFYNLYGGGGMEYRKSDTLYTDTTLEAPMNERPELLEWQYSTGLALDGIQIGQDEADTARKWKGYVFDVILYNRILTTNERRRVMLYFNVRYGTNNRGVPLYFPSPDLLPERVGWVRFREVPPDYDQITDRWQYEDAMEDFNEVANTAPREWEIGYDVDNALNVSTVTTGATPVEVADAQRAIFDGFNDQARRANPFYFRDKYGDVWPNVRIAAYDRDHDGHRSWRHSVVFRLRSNTGTVITAADAGGEYIIDGGIG